MILATLLQVSELLQYLISPASLYKYPQVTLKSRYRGVLPITMEGMQFQAIMFMYQRQVQIILYMQTPSLKL